MNASSGFALPSAALKFSMSRLTSVVALVVDRAGADHVRRPRRSGIGRRVVIFRKRQRFARLRPLIGDAAGRVDLEAAQPLVDIGHEARLGVFAVVDDVDAELDLLVHDLDDRRAQALLVGLRVIPRLSRWRPSSEQIGRPRQAADMGGENAVVASFHVQSRLPRAVEWEPVFRKDMRHLTRRYDPSATPPQERSTAARKPQWDTFHFRGRMA